MSWRVTCDECDGTGERDWLEGGHCYFCGGSGLEPDDDDEYGPDDVDFWETFYDGIDLKESANADDRRAFRGDRTTTATPQDAPKS